MVSLRGMFSGSEKTIIDRAKTIKTDEQFYAFVKECGEAGTAEATLAVVGLFNYIGCELNGKHLVYKGGSQEDVAEYKSKLIAGLSALNKMNAGAFGGNEGLVMIDDAILYGRTINPLCDGSVSKEFGKTLIDALVNHGGECRVKGLQKLSTFSVDNYDGIIEALSGIGTDDAVKAIADISDQGTYARSIKALESLMELYVGAKNGDKSVSAAPEAIRDAVEKVSLNMLERKTLFDALDKGLDGKGKQMTEGEKEGLGLLFQGVDLEMDDNDAPISGHYWEALAIHEELLEFDREHDELRAKLANKEDPKQVFWSIPIHG